MSTEAPPPPPPPAAAASTDDRTVAILAYITLIGFIIAIVMHGNKKTALGTFHLRQALGLFITGFVGWFVLLIIPVVGWICMPFFGLGIFILAIIGIITASGGKEKNLPILGDKYAKWFANSFS